MSHPTSHPHATVLNVIKKIDLLGPTVSKYGQMWELNSEHGGTLGGD